MITKLSGSFFKTIFLAFILFCLQACAPALYHVNLRYEPSEKFLGSEKTKPDFVVTVAKFKDMRQMDDKLQLGTVTIIDGSRIPILPKYVKVPDAVTKSIRKYFLKAGYNVSNNVPAWNLKEDAISKDWGTILIGGNINELEIFCDDSIPVTDYRAKVKLTLVFANVSAKRIFYQTGVESSSSLKDVFFSEKMLEEQINAALSDALERILDDSKARRRIEDAAKQKSGMM